MDPTTAEENWRPFTDPYGHFRIEIPASWRVEQSDGPFTHGRHAARRFLTLLEPSPSGSSTRRIWMTIRIEQYAETPPLISKGLPESADVQYLRTYHVAHESDWLTCVVGHIHIHIEYRIQDIPVSSPYKSMEWEPPAPLSPDEQRKRLALVKRIIASFDLLALG